MSKIFIETISSTGQKVLIEVKSFMFIDDEDNISLFDVEKVVGVELKEEKWRTI